jgi:hypothetical protein
VCYFSLGSFFFSFPLSFLPLEGRFASALIYVSNGSTILNGEMLRKMLKEAVVVDFIAHVLREGATSPRDSRSSGLDPDSTHPSPWNMKYKC